MTATETENMCRHCGRPIEKDAEGLWVDPAATGDDSIWRETCDSHDTFTAEHEPGAKFIVQDWTGRRLFPDRTFDTFEDGWGFIRDNVKDEDNAYDDYYVTPDTLTSA